MTILVAYVPRPEGQAALDKGIEIARRRQERLVVVNASPGGGPEKDTRKLADAIDVERVETLLADSGLDAEFRQFVRGKSALAEIEELVEQLGVSLVVIGLRKRTPMGKLILGSVAQDILLGVACPVLAVKAY